MSGSERVWLIVGADWPSDNDLSNIAPRSIAVVPEKESSSPGAADPGSSIDTGIVIAIVFAVLVLSGILSLITDGTLMRRRRREAAAASEADVEAGLDGDVELEEQRPPPQNQAAAGEEGAAAAPGAPPPAAWNQLGRTTAGTLVIVIAGAMTWALYYLIFGLTELEPYFAQSKPRADGDLRRVHVFEAALVFKLFVNLQMLAAVVYPEPFWLEARIYQGFSAVVALAYSILSVFSMVYLREWSYFLRGDGEDGLATKCLVGFWTEFCYLMVAAVLLMVLVAISFLR